MQIGLIGSHPDGLAVAQALSATGRYTLAAFAGPANAPVGAAERIEDIESLLALRELELIIVADELAHRADTLRRAVQSDRHVLCVQPADMLPDITYEVAMIQEETRKLLLPILPARLSPGMQRLRTLLEEGGLGTLQLIQWELPLSPPLAK